MTSAGETDPNRLLPLPAAAFHILIALAETDRHGYAIMREVAERSGGRIKLNPGTLYTTIRRLLEQGLIAELDARPVADRDDERRRYYRLTSLGRTVAQLELQRLGELLTMARDAGLALGRSEA